MWTPNPALCIPCEANALLHGEESEAFADAGYQGVEKRDDANPDVRWNVAMRPGKRKALDKTKTVARLKDKLEKLPRIEEEHRATDDAVRTFEPVDGPRKTASTGWADPPANR